MPKINLKEEEPEEPVRKEEMTPIPSLRGMEEESRGPGPILQVIIAIIFLGLLTLALHYFGIITLWGPEKPAETGLPEPVQVAPQEQAPATTPEPAATPLPAEKPAATRPALPPSGSGEFTVQVSSWLSRAKADEEVARLTGANLDAFVESATVDGVERHRVRVGRYATRQEAGVAAQRLGEMLENGAWVARIGS